jgi:TBC1 domain family member 10
MQDKPCRMRGMFGEGMRETHQALYVAEKLIQQFLPKLAKHFDKESIHITMFATQWLLTQFTSSFRFELVTRLWDCYLFEGWKATYRVMLALLQRSQVALLSLGFEDILAYFRELPDRPDIDGSIVDDAMKIPLKTSHIRKYELEWRTEQSQHHP